MQTTAPDTQTFNLNIHKNCLTIPSISKISKNPCLQTEKLGSLKVLLKPSTPSASPSPPSLM